VSFIRGKNQRNNSCQIRVKVLFCCHVIDHRLKLAQLEPSGLASSIPASSTTSRQTTGLHTHGHQIWCTTFLVSKSAIRGSVIRPRNTANESLTRYCILGGIQGGRTAPVLMYAERHSPS
jgi:hypothetical protein